MFLYLLAFLAILTNGIVTDEEIDPVITNGMSKSDATPASLSGDPKMEDTNSSKTNNAPGEAIKNIPANPEGLTDHDFVTEEKRPTLPPDYGLTDNDFVTEEKRPTLPPNYGLTDHDFVTEEKRPTLPPNYGLTDNDFVTEEKRPTLPPNYGLTDNDFVTEEKRPTLPPNYGLTDNDFVTEEKRPTIPPDYGLTDHDFVLQEKGLTSVNILVNDPGSTNNEFATEEKRGSNEDLKMTDSQIPNSVTLQNSSDILRDNIPVTTQINPLNSSEAVQAPEEKGAVISNVSTVAIVTTQLSNSSSGNQESAGGSVPVTGMYNSSAVTQVNGQLDQATTAAVRNMSSNKPVTDNPHIPVEPTYEPRGFDGSSFVGGIVLCAGVVAIIFFTYKFCNTRRDDGYHQV